MIRTASLALLIGPNAVAADLQHFDTVERGRYLTTLGDCAACHTASGGKPFAGGRAIETPFGALLSPNITADRETGIGKWTDNDFFDALHKGRGHDGTFIYPAMPYTYYRNVSQDDALAIRAYLASIPAVHNAVQVNQLPFPFDIRVAVSGWDLLFFDKGGFQPDGSRSAEWNRGAYLVTGLEHCGMCHTPKNFLGADDTSHALQGYALQGWFAPNITNDERRGVGHWSVHDIVQHLRTGHNKFAGASGPMAEEISESSSHVAEADLHAIAIYLKSQPGQAHERDHPVSADDPFMRAGAAIYADACSSCHTSTGSGIAGLFPALAGGAAIQQENPASVLRVILRGAHLVSTAQAPRGPAMPSFAWQLDNAQIAAVATYVRNAWGNAAPSVSASTVGDVRRQLSDRAGD